MNDRIMLGLWERRRRGLTHVHTRLRRASAGIRPPDVQRHAAFSALPLQGEDGFGD